MKAKLALLAFLSLTQFSLADDWPQWRGPQRDGVWRETGIVEKFKKPELDIRWRVPISSGYSGVSVAEGRVYVSDRVLEPKQKERIHCFDAATGNALWTHDYPCDYTISYTAGPRATITIDGGKAFALGAMGHFHCLDAATGKVLWDRDLNNEYNVRMPIWGIAAAPLVHQGRVIVHIGGADGASIVAFDIESGEEAWRALNDRASYSAPIIINQADKQVLICWTGDNVAALDPISGDVHWKVDFQPQKMVINIATPVVDDNRLFVTSFYDGSMLLDLKSKKLAAEAKWRRIGRSEKETDALHSIMSTPYIGGDYIYGVYSYGEFRSLEAATGDRVWQDTSLVSPNRWANIHMVRNGENMWMFNEQGELIIARLSPEGAREIDRAQLISPTKVQLRRREGVCWAHPAYAHRRVYARNDEELVCASLAAEE